MSSHEVAMFVHLLGVITLFGGIGLQQRGGTRLRQATTVGEVRLWLALMRPTGRMLPAAVLILLASGLHLTAEEWTPATSWIATAAVTVLAMAAVGAGMLGRRFRAVGIASADTTEGPVPLQVAGLLRAAGVWAALSGMNGAALGVLWLMTNKPGWATSAGVVVGATVIGAGVGAILDRNEVAASSRWRPKAPGGIRAPIVRRLVHKAPTEPSRTSRPPTALSPKAHSFRRNHVLSAEPVSRVQR
jgi:hypothetical protein